jgi:hypothetical protein
MIGHWFDPESESKDWIIKLKKIQATEGRHVYEAHRALDWILQDLKRFPELGWSFLRAGMQSPVTETEIWH